MSSPPPPPHSPPPSLFQLISQGAASTGLSELIVAIGRSQDPYQLSEKVIPHLEVIFKVPINSEKSKLTRNVVF